MGIGLDFGPAKEQGFDPHGGDWLGTRTLTGAHLRELARHVESWGYPVEEHAGRYFIDVPCEEFMFSASGGYLSQPGAGAEGDRDDAIEEQVHLAERICDFAGWVIVGEGFDYGFEARDDGYVVLTSPPEEPAETPAAAQRL